MVFSQQLENTAAKSSGLQSRQRTVSGASFLLIGACCLILLSTQDALASCGDHLQQSVHFGINRIKSDSRLPVKCIHCSGRSDAPIPLPLRITDRLEKDAANVFELLEAKSDSSDSVDNLLQLFAAQCFHEVSTPPPKFSVFA
ncbi:MAG: hypothetical protein U0930_04165 [Pirellulales bacterium]